MKSTNSSKPEFEQKKPNQKDQEKQLNNISPKKSASKQISPVNKSIRGAKEVLSDGVEKTGKVLRTGAEAGLKGVEKGAEIAEEGIEVAGKSVELAGKGVEMTGKGVQYAGKGVEYTGEFVEKEVKAGADSLIKIVKKRRSIRDFFWRSRRGVITGCADNDPSGIVTYTQTGAITGFKLLWMCIIAWPLLTVIEEMSARIGVVTKRGVNQVVIENYGKAWAYLAALIVLVCNTFTMGADIAAMADVASILTRIPAIIFILGMGGLFFYLLWKKGYRAISNYLFILTPFFLLYVASALFLHVPWGEALRNTFVPAVKSLNLNFALIAVAFLGTTLSPYLIFWETTQEIEEGKNVSQLKEESKGVAAGMFFSQFITFFIIVAAAAVFAGSNHQLNSAREVALALKPLGNASFLFYSLGILGAGLLGIPVLAASTGYTFSETFGWKRGLDQPVRKAKGFYTVMILTLIIGVAIALFKFNPVLALIYSQVLNGLLMPILVVLLLLITNNKKIMGQHTNSLFTNFFGVLAFIVLVGSDIALIVQWLK